MQGTEEREELNGRRTRRIVEEVWNHGVLDEIDELYAADCVVETPHATLYGREEYADWVRNTHAAFPDFEMELADLIASGDRVAARYRATGTHKGRSELFDLDPTGQAIDVDGVVVARFQCGKCVEEHVVTDSLAMFRQLGLVPDR